MKVEMTENGTVIISPENGAEVVALKAWSDNFFKHHPGISFHTEKTGVTFADNGWATLLIGCSID